MYLWFSILELSKILMYESWNDYVKPKHGKKTKLCYMDTDSFIVFIKKDDIYKDIAEDVERRFDTSNYDLECSSVERWIRQKNHNKICWIKSKNLQLLNRWL